MSPCGNRFPETRHTLFTGPERLGLWRVYTDTFPVRRHHAHTILYALPKVNKLFIHTKRRSPAIVGLTSLPLP
jgi:hypothetical protein